MKGHLLMLLDEAPTSKTWSEMTDSVKYESCLLFLSEVDTASVCMYAIWAPFSWIEQKQHDMKHAATVEDTTVL